MNRRTGFAAAVVGLALGLGFAGPAAAQDYPSRAITLIVPYPAGGGVDAMARIVGEKLSAALGQQVVVDNRGGGGGNIGTRAAAKSPPDGYTLLLGHTGTISINPSLYVNAGYDPRKDFAPIGLMASMPVVLLAHPSFPGKTVADVIAIAKKQPGKHDIGTSAIGTGGYVPIAFGVLPPALGNLSAGNLRAIAVLSPKRSSLLPDAPTAAESGLPD